MRKIVDRLYLFETSDYYKMKDPFLFYDISELGWARYLSAHINYLTKNGKHVAVCTNKSREVLYRGFATEILPMPDEYYEKFGKYLSASYHLHDPVSNKDITDQSLISIPFKKSYPDYNLITDYAYNYSKFEHERIFQKYNHSKEIEEYCKKFRKCIVVLPRHRTSRFAIRNISEDKWNIIINTLCESFKEFDVISIGNADSTLNIKNDNKNYFNIIDNKDNLEILVALCNTNKVVSTIGTQSGIMHIATYSGSPSFIIGTNPNDMGMDNENWNNSPIKFWYTDYNEKGYLLNDFDLCVKKIIEFTNDNCA